MLKELVQELNQIVTEVETLTRENGELKTEKENFDAQLAEVNESLRVALENKVALETEVNNLNATIENLNNAITEKDNRITELENRIAELENQTVDPTDLEELRTVVAELKAILAE